MKDLTTISTDLFNKVRSRFSNIKLGDGAGTVITDPANARFFDLDFTHESRSLGHVNIKLDDKSLTVIYNDSMVEGQNAGAKDTWYNFLKELRMFAKSNMLNFDTRDITKTNLDKRDYEYLAQENGETNMRESKLWGTSKTSFQEMGEAKIIVKHTQPVNYNLPAGRTMHIDSIYIENAQGERFRYPHRHLNGARAMAVHVANGGTVYDSIGSHISSLSEELSKLRQFKNYTNRNGLQEALSDISELVLTRITDIKEQIAKLQRQNYYSEFKEGFEPSNNLPVPEETVNNWIDALTIRTFNEELKTVFPFIYRLVDQPKTLGYEDLVGEAKEGYCDACDRPSKECVCDDELDEHNHLADYEQHLEDITAFEYDMQEGALDELHADLNDKFNELASGIEKHKDEEGADRLYDELLAVAKQHGQTGVQEFKKMLNGARNNAHMDFDTNPGHFKNWFWYLPLGDEQSGEDDEDYYALPMPNGDRDESIEPQQSAQAPNARAVVEFIMSMYDQENGTFPKGEEGVKIAVEKQFGDQAGQFASQVVERLSGQMTQEGRRRSAPDPQNYDSDEDYYNDLEAYKKGDDEEDFDVPDDFEDYVDYNESKNK